MNKTTILQVIIQELSNQKIYIDTKINNFQKGIDVEYVHVAHFDR